MVEGAGRDPRYRADKKIAKAKWTRPRDLSPNDYDRVCRLGDVARSRLVFDHFPHPRLHRTNVERTSFRYSFALLARAAQRAFPNHRERKLPSSRQPASCLHHALGLSRVFAVTRHLVGRFAAR